MVMKNIEKAIALFEVACLVLTSCSSTTLIVTDPPNAKVYADGKYLGRSPVAYSDRKVVGATTTISLEKEGCERRAVPLTRDEEVRLWIAACGWPLILPPFWSAGYKPEHTYYLKCRE